MGRIRCPTFAAFLFLRPGWGVYRFLLQPLGVSMRRVSPAEIGRLHFPGSTVFSALPDFVTHAAVEACGLRTAVETDFALGVQGGTAVARNNLTARRRVRLGGGCYAQAKVHNLDGQLDVTKAIALKMLVVKGLDGLCGSPRILIDV